MLGLNEILMVLLVVALISLFGRKTIRKLAKDYFGLKKDVESIQKAR